MDSRAPTRSENGMNFRGQVWNRVPKNYIFWRSEILVWRTKPHSSAEYLEGSSPPPPPPPLPRNRQHNGNEWNFFQAFFSQLLKLRSNYEDLSSI